MISDPIVGENGRGAKVDALHVPLIVTNCDAIHRRVLVFQKKK